MKPEAKYPRTTSVPHQREDVSKKPVVKLGTAVFGNPKDLQGQEDFNDVEEESEISGEERTQDRVNVIPNSQINTRNVEESIMNFDNAQQYTINSLTVVNAIVD